MSAQTSITIRSERRGGGDMTGSDTLLLTARAEIYRCLSLAFADPQAGIANTLTRQWPVTVAALEALGIASREAAGVAGDLAGGALSDAALESAHAACFGHAVSKDCPPYEAEYGQAHIFEKTQTLADISGFYRAFGLESAAAIRMSPRSSSRLWPPPPRLRPQASRHRRWRWCFSASHAGGSGIRSMAWAISPRAASGERPVARCSAPPCSQGGRRKITRRSRSISVAPARRNWRACPRRN